MGGVVVQHVESEVHHDETLDVRSRGRVEYGWIAVDTAAGREHRPRPGCTSVTFTGTRLEASDRPPSGSEHLAPYRCVIEYHDGVPQPVVSDNKLQCLVDERQP